MYSSEIKGVQILCCDQKSVGLASLMQNTFNEELNTNLSYIINNYQLLKWGNQPSIIIECGFFSNEEDEKLLQTDKYQNRITDIIAEVIKKELKI